MAKILYSDYYLPSKKIQAERILRTATNFEIPTDCIDKNKYIDKFLKESRIEKITIEDNVDLIAIFSQLVAKLFDDKKIQPEQIKYLFYTSPRLSVVNKGISVPYYIIEKFKLTQASTMIISQSCCSTLRAIDIAKTYNDNDDSCYSLILSPSFYDDYEMRVTKINISGDGAGILLVGFDNDTDGFSIIGSTSSSDGSLSYSNYHNNDYSRTNLKKMTSDVKCFKSIFNKNNIELNDIKIIIPQSVNYSYLFAISRFVKVPIKKFFTNNISDGGHLGSVDLIRNFKDVTDLYTFSEGDYMATINWGNDDFGESFGSMLFRYSMV